MKWGQIREKGRLRFVFLYSAVLSVPLTLDYYIIKFFIKSFRLELSYVEFFSVLATCMLVSFIFASYGWNRIRLSSPKRI